jgi:hypothetical protein
MFVNPKIKVKFLKALYLPGHGNIWYGKTAEVDKEKATAYINRGYAEPVEENKKQVETHGKQSGNNKRGKAAFKS